MRAILLAIGGMRAPSRELNSVADREAFLRALPPGVLPSQGEIGAPVPLALLRQHHAAGSAGGAGTTGQGAGTASQGGASSAGATAARAGGAASRGSTTPPKTVFKKGELNVTAPFAKPIFDELCKMEQAGYPNAVTVLLRVFIERSMLRYADKHGIATQDKGHQKRLSRLISEVHGHMQAADPTLSLPSLSRIVAAGQTSSFTDALNRVVHDPYAFASAADVLMIANTFRDFLKAVWSRL